MSVLPKVPPDITGSARDYLIELVRQMERELGRRHPVQADGKQYIGFERPYVYVDAEGEQYDLVHKGQLSDYVTGSALSTALSGYIETSALAANGGPIPQTDVANTFAPTQEFTTMPTVGGDPIVESGSNSDGEWTRWADGTQQCTNAFALGNNLGTTVNGFYRVNQNVASFPVSFVAAPRLSISVNNSLTSSSYSIAVSDSSTNSATTSSTGRIRGLVTTSTAVMGVDVVAFGRWK